MNGTIGATSRRDVCTATMTRYIPCGNDAREGNPGKHARDESGFDHSYLAAARDERFRVAARDECGSAVCVDGHAGTRRCRAGHDPGRGTSEGR